MSRFLLLVAVLFLASACTATVPLHGTVSLDSRFSPEETESILAAAAQWRAATGMVDLSFQVTDSPERADYAVVRRSGLDTHRGLTTQTTGTVLIEIWPADIYNSAGYENSIPDSGSVEEVALHEFGHAFGLTHQREGLMTPGGLTDANGQPLPDPTCIDSFTLARFCELYSCPTTHPTCPQ